MQRKRRDLSGVCEPGRSQSPHSTDAVGSKPIVKSPGSKTGPREGGQEGGDVTTTTEAQTASGMPETAARDAEAHPMIAGVEAGVWTERMLSALVNGVKGGKWFSLMDKVFAPKTLALAWTKVRANKGAAGVDGQSIEQVRGEGRAVSVGAVGGAAGGHVPVRRPSSGWTSRRAMAGRGRWAFRRSRIASCNRLSGS